jgi:hypothetical protein
MTTAIIALLALAVFHFIYESILAPSLRLSLRFRLFVLRDEVRQLKLACVESLHGQHLAFLQDSIDGLTLMLNHVDIASLVGVGLESRRDPTFLEQARERARMLDDCTELRVREIRKQTLKIAAEALVVNSGAWVVLFFAPWIIASIGYSEAKRRFSVLASLNSREFKRVSPVESAAAAVI